MNQEINYNGNVNLKGLGVVQKLTPEQEEEWMRCALDPIYFCEKYIKIVHVDRGFIPFKMYDYQKDIIKSFTDDRKVVVLTARQAGKTTTAMAFILHYILFNTFKRVGILANKRDSAAEVLSRVKMAYEAIPKWMQQGVKRWNERDIELENGCTVVTGATTSSSIRGKSINVLYIDEAAFVTGYDEFFTSVYPTISSGDTTKVLLTSTPNGLNHFHKTFTNAENGKNGYTYHRITWDMVPGRGEEWFKETMNALDHDTDKFAQEYNGEFLGSSGTLINGSALKALVDKPPLKKQNSICMYQEPIEDHTYAIIVDTSRGKGLDHSAFSVIDVTDMPYNQVCTFRDNYTGPMDYSEIVYRAAKSYNDAFVLIEVNDLGQQVSDLLHHEYEYENILSTESAGRSGKRISGGFGAKAERGITTSKTVKSIGCSTLKMLIEQHQLLVNDKETINELSTFSKKGNSYEAEEGKHDDLVMGLVLFSWLTTQDFFKEITNINTLVRLREKSTEEIEEELMPFGFTWDDIEPTATYHDDW